MLIYNWDWKHQIIAFFKGKSKIFVNYMELKVTELSKEA